MNADAQIVEVAGHLYDEYCRAVGGVAFNGDPLPSWDAFRDDPAKQKQANAWIAVANNARNYFTGPQ